jgi:hypothetical protein
MVIEDLRALVLNSLPSDEETDLIDERQQREEGEMNKEMHGREEKVTHQM